MTQYIDSYKPIAAYNLRYSVIEQFAAGLNGIITRYHMNRSRIDIHNSDDDFTYECRVVKAKCPVCGEWFIDITFLDNPGSHTGCDCGALLEY